MKSTRISLAHETSMRLASPSLVSICFKVSPMSPTSWPDRSTCPVRTWFSSSMIWDSRKLVETSLTSEVGEVVLPGSVPLIRTWQVARSHDGGETSYVTQ